ncbi:IMPACT family protein [Fulvivirga lutimaris]|uniref:IMPACT family protein n=1 Tax=Fulvivirga lutimaris TaxID=1819566 RepID=UPI0012BC903D|nr:YigZ family protein [Fulvivirga lutimaris]MTI40553.1 YigZ family protein [Fulvivirga lutimaris]
MITEFKTLAKPGEGLFKDRGSKFLGFATHVTSEEEVKEFLADLRKQYYDARHHCYAYVLGADRKTFRANDDGEPNHSAGDPILGQINSKELTDTLVVVIRYFGGTKLGVSGLINAYKLAAEEALDNASFITVEVQNEIVLQYGYDDTNEVMRLVNELKINIVDQKFEASCELIGTIKINLAEQLESKVQLLNDLGHKIDLKVED